MMSEDPIVDFGLIQIAEPGRTDTRNVSLPNGAYVIPADVVSALGEGNTLAGSAVLDKIFPIKTGGGIPVPIVIAGGEYVVSPGDCRKVGGGNIKHGHEVLDKFVLSTRKNTINELKKLPGPQK